MKTNLKALEKCCLTPTAEWFNPEFVEKQGFVAGGDDKHPYLFSDRKEPILAVAHLDVVERLKPEFSVNYMAGHEKPEDKKYAWTPFGDDRAGVYTLLYHLPKLGLKYDVLLTTGEETGQTSAKQFKSDKQYNWIFEFDRHGDDVVMYSYEDGELGKDKFFDKLLALFGMTLGNGSFSDIEALQDLKCIGFNIGTGYHNEHTQDSYIDTEELEAQVERFCKFYRAFKDVRLEYVPKPKVYTWPSQAQYSKTGYHGYEDWDDYRQDVVVIPGNGKVHDDEDKIRWDEWRHRTWFCNCPSGFTRKPNEKKCDHCGATKAAYIQSVAGRLNRPETAKVVNWATCVAKEYIDFRNALMQSMVYLVYEKEIVPYLTIFASEEHPTSLTYRIKTKAAAIGRMLTPDEVKLLMTDKSKSLEFINGALSLNGKVVMDELLEVLEKVVDAKRDQYKIARKIMAILTTDKTLNLCDFLDAEIRHLMPQGEAAESVKEGKEVWEKIVSVPSIKELLIPTSVSIQIPSTSNVSGASKPPLV